MLEYCGSAVLGAFAHLGIFSFPYRTCARIDPGITWHPEHYLLIEKDTLYLARVNKWTSHCSILSLPSEVLAVAEGGYIYCRNYQHYKVTAYSPPERISPPTMGRYYLPPKDYLSIDEYRKETSMSNMLHFSVNLAHG